MENENLENNNILTDTGLTIRRYRNKVEKLKPGLTHGFHINTKDIKPWAGLRPMSPNMLPIYKKSKEDRVWYNTGHGHLGWTLSAYTAKHLVDNFATE